jgi:hypothetical protein
MRELWGIPRYEYLMQIRRPGLYARYAFFVSDAKVAASFRPPDRVNWAIVNMVWLVGMAIVALALIPLALRWRERWT